MQETAAVVVKTKGPNKAQKQRDKHRQRILVVVVHVIDAACPHEKGPGRGARQRRQTEKATVKMQQEPALTGKQQQKQQEERAKVMENIVRGKGSEQKQSAAKV